MKYEVEHSFLKQYKSKTTKWVVMQHIVLGNAEGALKIGPSTTLNTFQNDVQTF